MTVVDYILVETTMPCRLEKEVAGHAAEGYQPFGPLVIHEYADDVRFFQPMVLYSRDAAESQALKIAKGTVA